MKEYLQLFRDQAFNGAFALMKRILVSNILITIILSIVGILTIFPLVLKGIGWSLEDMMGFKDKMQTMPKDFTSMKELGDYFLSLLGDINYGYLLGAFVLAFLFSAYQYVVFFKLNDNAVRYNNTNLIDALKMSLNGKILSMIGLYLALSVISMIIFFLFMLILVPLYSVSVVLAVLVGFILFFVVCILIIRFTIAPAAMVHGNMGIFESIGFSFRKITWKRGGMLFLMGLVFAIAGAMLSGITSSITGAIFGFNNTNMTAFVLTQIIASALGAILSAFLYSALTAIYFRYSDDMRDDVSGTVEEHLIS